MNKQILHTCILELLTAAQSWYILLSAYREEMRLTHENVINI